jgi:hypothetical protein
MELDRIKEDLLRPEAYGHGPDRVELVETHISWVFLAGDLVFKVKKPVDFGFLDFSTPDKRHHFCQEEVRLNRRLAPDIYLDVVAVVQGRDGRLAVNLPGPTVDFAVMMKRLPDHGLMSERLDQGLVFPETMDDLAGLLADFYNRAETGGPIDQFGRAVMIKHNTDEDSWQTVPYVGTALSGERYDHIKAYNDRFLREASALLDRRVADGFIRDCHGDLHLGNICLGEKIWIFDCIEFNENFRYSDVASDLAFLAMDLDFRGRSDLGRRLVDRYVELSGDKEIFLVLDFYKCYRAYVRGKINCLAHDQQGLCSAEKDRALDLARRYFDLAYTYAGGRRRPRILAFCGLMGTGKTHWARRVGEKIGAPVLSSDRVRKQTAGLTDASRVYVPFGQGLYSQDKTEQVYESLHAAAAALAGAGLDVVLDASYMKRRHRAAAQAMAESIRADLVFIQTVADEETVISRLSVREARGRSLSDGRRELYWDQSRCFEPLDDLTPDRLVTVDTAGSMEETAAKIWTALGISD